MDSKPKCTSSKKGTTLIEVVTAMAIISIVVAGLGSVYVPALDQWKQTVLRIRLQQAGTYCVEEMVRSLQSASTIAESDGKITARYIVPDLYIDTSVVFRRMGTTLEKDGKRFFPFPDIEKNFEKSVEVRSIALITPQSADSLYRLHLVLTAIYPDKTEDMDFYTEFSLRNAPVAEVAQGSN